MIAWRMVSTNSHVPYTKYGSVSTVVSFHQSLGQPFFKLERHSVTSPPSSEKLNSLLAHPQPSESHSFWQNSSSGRELGARCPFCCLLTKPQTRRQHRGPWTSFHLLWPLTSPCLGKTGRKWRFTSLMSCPRSSVLQKRVLSPLTIVMFLLILIHPTFWPLDLASPQTPKYSRQRFYLTVIVMSSKPPPPARLTHLRGPSNNSFGTLDH